MGVSTRTEKGADLREKSKTGSASASDSTTTSSGNQGKATVKSSSRAKESEEVDRRTKRQSVEETEATATQKTKFADQSAPGGTFGKMKMNTGSVFGKGGFGSFGKLLVNDQGEYMLVPDYQQIQESPENLQFSFPKSNWAEKSKAFDKGFSMPSSDAEVEMTQSVSTRTEKGADLREKSKTGSASASDSTTTSSGNQGKATVKSSSRAKESEEVDRRTKRQSV